MFLAIVDAGGRGNALMHMAERSNLIDKYVVIPGNAGVSQINREEIPTDAIAEIVYFATEACVDFVIAGDDASVAHGLVDACTKAEIRAFGPTQDCAQLESSKIFGKNFCREYGIPTADFVVVSSRLAAGSIERCTRTWGAPPVVKADGLRRGKGVFLPSKHQSALAATQKLFRAGEKEVLLEAYLPGWEFTLMLISDGVNLVVLPPVADFKRLTDAPDAPNTGGVGGYAPETLVSPPLLTKVMEKIALPTIHAMQKRGTPYHGVLNLNIKVTSEGPKLLEYNCRFGDPEIETLLPLCRSDLIEYMYAACEYGGLAKLVRPQFFKEHAVSVVGVTQGYPGDPVLGDRITGIEEAKRMCHLFHAGTTMHNGEYYTNGGRVVVCVGTGSSRVEASQRAYGAMGLISWRGKRVREGIGSE